MEHGMSPNNDADNDVDAVTASCEGLHVWMTCDIIIEHYLFSALTIESVKSEPQQQQQQVVRETGQSNNVDDGLLPILKLIINFHIIHTDLTDDACSDESQSELKLELA